MKKFGLIVLLSVIMLSCDNKKNDTADNDLTPTSSDSTKDVVAFFPVTDYIKGEIEKLKSEGKNPIKYINNKENKPDSIWIKVQDFEKEFKDFFTPSIDSAGDAKYYSEKRFFDNTINAITLTYDPINELPASKPWTHWDIYIDPETNDVTRIYLVKINPDSSVRQLTWIPNKSCKSITIYNDGKTSSIKDEVNIKW